MARLSSLAGVTLPATFDHSWFSAAHYNPKVLSCDSTPHGGGWLYNHPCVYELLGREFVGLFDILGVTAPTKYYGNEDMKYVDG